MIPEIGIYAEGLDIIVTGESSYSAADYYSRITGVTQQQMADERSRPGTVALGRFAGNGIIHRILSMEPVLAFVSSLPLNALAGKSYAFFHLNADRLYACMPESEAGILLLTDDEGNPVLPETEEIYGEISRQYMKEQQSRLRTGKNRQTCQIAPAGVGKDPQKRCPPRRSQPGKITA